MKSLCRIVAFVLMCSAGSLAQASDMNIGAVDMRRVMEQAPMVKSMNAQLENELKPKEEKLRAMKKTLDQAMQRLSKNSSTLSSSEIASSKKDIASKQDQLRKAVADFQKAVQQGQSASMQKFNTMMSAALEKVAKDKDFKMILVKDALLYVDKDQNIDVTDQVIAALPK